MNKIYQVIWSHVKHCYVVTSELAKRHGKCGNGHEVRGMRMGVGGVRRGALALGVTAALLSGWTGVGTSVAHAESVVVAGGSEITISDNQSLVTYNLNGSNITFTVASEGSVHDIYGNGTASISLNTVYVYGTVSGSYVTGGYAFNGGEVTENTVTVSGDAALINGTVYGGNAGNGLQASGSATGNKVFIYGGMVKKAVYGGYSYSRDANENKVTIEDGSVVSVNGGYSPSQSAIKNQVTISGGSVTSGDVRAVVGGAGGSRGENSVTQENEVIIKGNAKVTGSVIGGAEAASAAVVNKNTVTIKDSAEIGGSMYGGYGYLNVKDKTENKVFIEGGSVSGNVYGGYIEKIDSLPAGDEPAGNVKKNEVHITGGTVGTSNKNYIAGGYVDVNGTGAAMENAVTVTGGTVKGRVYGGYVKNATGAATGNEVTIEDGSVVSVTGGFSTTQSAIKNRVTISGGSVTNSSVRAVVGGAGGSTGEDSVTQENEVVIKGNAKVAGSVIGGADATSEYAENYAAVVNKNTVTIKDSAVIDDSIYGGYGNLNVKDKTENKVFIEGGSVRGNVYGGYITKHSMGADVEPAGNVKKNEIHITGGTVGTNYKNDIAGGYVDEYATGAAMDNAVTVTGGTVKGRVYGGRVNNATGAATGNKLNISVADTTVADTVLENNAYGGYAIGTGEVSNNNVTITGGTLNYHVYGGYSEGGAARNNKVDISGKNTNVGADVYGGYNNKTDNAEFTVNNNTVKITDATIGGDVSGGEGDQNVFENRVEITGGKLGKMDDASLVMGGSAWDGSATKNEVGISGGTQLIGEVYGGYSSNSQTANNIVTLDNVTVKKAEEGYRGNVYGGCSDGDATGNSVTISGAETQVEGKVYGGYISKSSTVATGNTVEIKDGTIGISEGDTVFGGYANHGDSKQNNVSITGGTINGGVVGGYADVGDSMQNNVSITGGTVNGDVVGGDAYFDAAGNTVTLSNCTINGDVIGSRTFDGETKNNTVNLTGRVSGLDGAHRIVYGSWSSGAYTGNELHIGGTKDGSITGAWQGMTGDVVTNKISSVGDFESIVYHTVKWDDKVPALEVNTLYDVDAIDITNLAFDSSGTGTMALLKATADDSDLSSVKLNYSGGTGITITTSGVEISGGTPTTEKDGVNGVKLTSKSIDKVLLASDKKAINYSKGATTVSAITFGTFDIDKGARDLTGSSFATANTVDANDLKFADTATALKRNDSITLVTNATGIATTVVNNTDKTIAIKDYEDAQKIKYSATAAGDVTSAGGAVKYTVSSVTLDSVDLAGWTGTTSDLTTGNTSGWTGAGVAVAGSFTEPEVAVNSSRDILTSAVAGLFTDGAIDDAIKYKAGVAFEGDEANGVTLAGTQSKGVKADDGGKKLVYAAGTKDVTGITLGSMKVGTPRDMNTDYNFAGVTTLDASALTFDKPEDVNADVNLVTNASGIPTGMDATAGKDHSQSFEQTAENSVKLTANLKGAVTTDTNVVKYAYGGKELTKVDLKDWNGNEATFEATGWTKGASAVVETDGLSVTVDPGVEKTVLTFSGVDLNGITVNGEAYQWKDGGDSIAETSAENGVKITAGETTGGGIKGDGNKIIYKGSSKTVTGLEVTNVDFVKDGVARAFKNDYDLTNAAITAASDISVSNTEAMNPGDTMVVVDAVNAIKVAGEATRTLKDFTTTNAGDAIAFKDQIDGKALTLTGTHQDTLEQNEAKNQILYKVGDKNVTAAIFTGEVAWNDSEAYYTNDTTKHKFNGATDIDATALKVTGTSTKALQKGDAMTLLSAEGMTATLVKDQSDANKTASKITVDYSDATSGIGFGAEATGAVETAAGAVNYKVTDVTLNRVDLGSWNGTTSSVPGGWKLADGATINTDGLTAPTVDPGSHVDILQNDTDNYFASATISGANTYRSTDFKDEMNGVTLEGKQDKGVTLNSEKKHLIYAAGPKEAAAVTLGSVTWKKGATLVDASAGYDFTNVTALGTDNFAVTYDAPDAVAVNDSMTLLKANETLTAIVDERKTSSYKNYEIAPGVLMDGSITGTMSRSGNDVVFTATVNQADKLTFTDVEWKDSGALMTRPSNITFAGADVDTAKINFHNIQELAADKQMTLVSDFGNTVGTITGDTYTVGSGLQGEGAASLSGTDLVFTAKTGAESLTPTEATHETVMAMEAGAAVLATGREYVDSAIEGLGLSSNMAPDGTSTFASMGGGANRYKTGSHVDTHNWNAVVAVGRKNETEKGDLEWGVFAEYGRGNYTLHDDNGGRGDGNTHYAGGGLLAKWTNKHNVYTEASVRLGRVSDSAKNMLIDNLGNGYGYDVHANYFGAHVGLGKIYKVKGNHDLDVYGKFFYTKRNGVSFDAGGNHYNLDAVASSLLRIGARYGSNDRKWNWYGGLAYEYEFDGKSEGTVDGVAIRSASIKGSSVRGELGVRMEASKTNPWKADIGIYGYGGRHRGFGGTVSVAYMF